MQTSSTTELPLTFHLLFIIVRPGQSQPVSVHVVIVLDHVIGRLVGGDEHDLKLSRRFTLVHQLRVEVAQDGREVSTRRTPSSREVDPHHLVPQRLLRVDEVPVFIEQGPAGEHLHHGCYKSLSLSHTHTHFKNKDSSKCSCLSCFRGLLLLLHRRVYLFCQSYLQPILVITCGPMRTREAGVVVH